MNRLDLYPGLGLGPDQSVAAPTMVGVTQDATSSKYVPATAAEVVLTQTAASLPTGGAANLYLSQEASGTLVDTIGAVSMGNGGAAATYRVAIAGWTRKGWTSADAETTAFGAALGSSVTTSFLSILYVAMLAPPAAARTVFYWGNRQVNYNSTDRYAFTGGTISNGAVAVGTGVRPFVVLSDKTNNREGLYTDAEKLIPTYQAGVAGNCFVGGAVQSAPSMQSIYHLVITGASAELSDAQIKVLLQTLGWPVAWT